jgi:hypothetical protein
MGTKMVKKPSFMVVTSIIASVLMIINGVLIATSGKPIILTVSSFQVNTTVVGNVTREVFESNATRQVMNATSFWGRIVFGTTGLTAAWQTGFWLLLAIIILVCALAVYRKPKNHRKFSPLVGILSLLTLPSGGGFYLGTILGLVAAMVGYEWPKPFGETFFGKIFRAGTLDSRFYSTIGENVDAISGAALTVILVGFLSGLGNGLYAYNVNLLNQGGHAAYQILFDGQILWSTEVWVTTLSLIGMTLIKWLILSLAIYWVGARIVGIPSSYDKIARMVAFAYVPESLMIFLPALFSNPPTLTFNWPMALYIITTLWVFIAVLISVAAGFEMSRMRALAVAIFGGAVYWVTYYIFIVPTLNVPGVKIDIAMPGSSATILAALGLAAILSTILGLFSRKQSM